MMQDFPDPLCDCPSGRLAVESTLHGDELKSRKFARRKYSGPSLETENGTSVTTHLALCLGQQYETVSSFSLKRANGKTIAGNEQD